MTDELDDYLINQLGFQPKPQRHAGLERATSVFLGVFLEQETAIQALAIEPIYDGTDVLLVASTASGKTEAALVPIAARLISDPKPSLALYIAPTRALLNDLHRRLQSPLTHLGLEARVRHGDYPLPARTDSIRVLFTTPESLDVMLSKGTDLLTRAKYVIVDEVHQIFGNARGDQLAFDLQRLRRVVSNRVQVVALSATVGEPEAIATWINPAKPPAQIIPAPQPRRIVAKFQWLSDAKLYRRILRDSGYDKVLFFVNTRRRCDDVFLTLRNCDPYEVYVHYSTLSKQDREYVENGFKASDHAACVATTTLELGVDIGSVKEVVLADTPTTVSSFLQRIGRGGRRGHTNYVTMTPKTPLELLQQVAILQLAETGQVETGREGHPYSVVVQQIFSIIAGKRRLQVHLDELAETFAAWPWLSKEKVEAILERLVTKGYLQHMPGHQTYEVGSLLEDLLDRRAVFSNIGDESSGIAVFHEGQLIAHLPLRRDQMRHGNVILFAGRFWQIASITDQGLSVVLTRPVPNPILPVWGSKGSFSISAVLAKGMRDVLINKPTLDRHELDAECRQVLKTLYERASNVPRRLDMVWHEMLGDNHIYYTFAGALENRVLELLFEERGMPCRAVAGAEGIALTSRKELHFNLLPDTAEAVITTIVANWRNLASWITVGAFFELLPVDIRRDEVTARVASESLMSTVRLYCGAPEVSVRLKLVG